MYAYKWRCVPVCVCACGHVHECVHVFFLYKWIIVYIKIVIECSFVYVYLSTCIYLCTCVRAHVKCVSVFVCICFIWIFKDSTFSWLFTSWDSRYFNYIVRDSVSNKAWEPKFNSQHPWKSQTLQHGPASSALGR